ncbi:protein of unknown function [Microlunatus soli]|uniref:DUF222 domain-containing protein n=2 Tax=Microlunatus soli TaxID=630515 RepID=A0A1H1XEW3_9ACTN|nr:protein of unknown function [Microlunatus soli]
MIDGSGLMRHSLTSDGLDPSTLGDAELLDQVNSFRWLERAGINSNLILAAIWADRCPADSIDPYQLGVPGGDRPIRPGGDGTPEIARFAVTEFAASVGKSTGSGELMIADGLDLRYRLPRLWARLTRYEVDGRDCQTVARQTRHLTPEQALAVDASIADLIGRWSFGRWMKHLEAKIIEVDADNYKRLAEEAKKEIGLYLGQSNDHGIKTLYGRLPAPVAIRLYAQADRVADILARRGHTGSKGERHAEALDIMTRPLEHLRLLAEDTAPTLFDPDLDTDDDSLLPKPSTAAGAGTDVAQDEPEPEPDDFDDTGDEVPVGPSRFPRIDQDRRLAELAIKAIGQIDPVKLRPKATLYVHIARETLENGLGVARVEDVGPMVSSLVADWLRCCDVTVKPVIDLAADLAPVDSHEIPKAMRERMYLKYPGSVFPFSGSVGRRVDLDHSIPFTPGIPAQTAESKLGPAGRREHNVITHGLWRRRQPTPGTFVFRAPHGRVFLVNHTGTYDLGRGSFAQTIWHAAAPPSQTAD